MFESPDDLKEYVITNYTNVTDARINQDHWDLQCTKCKVTRGFQVVANIISGKSVTYGRFDQDFTAPRVYTFRCPVCKAFKQWIVYHIEIRNSSGSYQTYYFRVTSLPSEGLEEIDELPKDPSALRVAYRQAIRAMDANAYLAAAAMFRRALQVITRDLLGAKPGNLANELNEVIGRPFNGAVISTDFATMAYIVKEAGNQGAHPDKDLDLLEFTLQDAVDLQNIFMEIVSELFIVPAAKQKAKADFLARRKISLDP